MLARPKFRRWISAASSPASSSPGLAARRARSSTTRPRRPAFSPDLDDDYLIALARAANADYLVSGDRHLLDLEDIDPPVLTPRQFLDLLDA